MAAENVGDRKKAETHRCHRPAQGESGRCRYHGGTSKRGKDHHSYKHGFYSHQHHGILARAGDAQCRQLLGTRPPTRPDATPVAIDYRDRYHALTGRSLRVCPRCHDGQMQLVDGLVGTARRPAILDSS